MRRMRVSVVIALAWSAFAVVAADAATRNEDFRRQARQLEKDGDWAKACAFYAYLLTKDRSATDLKERFQTCLRHFHRVRRHQDLSYRQQVLKQEVPVALKLYSEVLHQLRQEYLDDDKSNLTRLFQQGLHELRLALNDDGFRREYLPGVKHEAIKDFLAQMNDTWVGKEIRDAHEAQNQAMRVALSAKKALGLKPTVAVLEIACGACNALDEHTYYLTPRQYLDDVNALHGEAVGVGIELTVNDNKLVIAQVFLNSPAARAGLVSGDRLVLIDQESTDKLTLESATDKLKGKVGSTTELAVLAGDKTRTVTLVRQVVNVSVTYYRILEPGVGYIQLANFHENALQEIDEALRQLEAQGMKSLVLDLRGNAGGLLESAIHVSERFLWEGAYIVTTRSRGRELKRTSRNVSPMLAPLVVLIDGGTASAAEILAGALKENVDGAGQPRAALVGQTTFGKGTIQHMVELKTVQAGGLRISWGKFFSPLNNPYNGFGVTPHVVVEPSSMGFDDQLRDAVQRAKLLAEQISMMSR